MSKQTFDILRIVIEELSARQTPETRAATRIVVRQYNDRIKRIKELNGIEDEPNMKLRLRTLAWEREFARNLIDTDEVDRFAGYQYLMRLARMEELIMHQHSVRAKPPTAFHTMEDVRQTQLAGNRP